jgi:hypothetical protein
MSLVLVCSVEGENSAARNKSLERDLQSSERWRQVRDEFALWRTVITIGISSSLYARATSVADSLTAVSKSHNNLVSSTTSDYSPNVDENKRLDLGGRLPLEIE